MKNIRLRKWQQEAETAVFQAQNQGRKSALVEACPAAGKTYFGMKMATDAMQAGFAKLICVVVPSRHLKLQWAQSALEWGIHLDYQYSYQLNREYQGVAITYSQFANNPLHFVYLFKSAYILFDEIHHCGDDNSWGEHLGVIEHESFFCLGLTGTPFRTDNAKIPFLRYTADGVSVPDYAYRYGDAVADGIVRETEFLHYGGTVAYKKKMGERLTDFAVEFSEHCEDRKALRVALLPESGWAERMIRDADERLEEIRGGLDPRAAMLVVCKSQAVTRQVAEIVHSIVGEKPVIAISDEEGSHEAIKQFRNGRAKAICATRMVSEGVDIPRIYVIVYLTNVLTRMYFGQIIGRATRQSRLPKAKQMAFVFLPLFKELVDMAESIKAEVRHVLREREAKRKQSEKNDDEVNFATEFIPVRELTSNSGLGLRIVDGKRTNGQLSLWDRVSMEIGEPDPDPDERLMAEQRAELKSEIKMLVRAWARKSRFSHGYIYGGLNQQQQVLTQDNLTNEGLVERINILRERMGLKKRPV